jgi:hypothetical protein
VLCAAGELMFRSFTRFEPDEQQTHGMPVLITDRVRIPAPRHHCTDLRRWHRVVIPKTRHRKPQVIEAIVAEAGDNITAQATGERRRDTNTEASAGARIDRQDAKVRQRYDQNPRRNVVNHFKEQIGALRLIMRW